MATPWDHLVSYPGGTWLPQITTWAALEISILSRHKETNTGTSVDFLRTAQAQRTFHYWYQCGLFMGNELIKTIVKLALAHYWSQSANQ